MKLIKDSISDDLYQKCFDEIKKKRFENCWKSSSINWIDEIKKGIINNIPIYIPNNTRNVLKKRYGKVHVRKSAGMPHKINDWVLIKNKYWLK